MKRSIVTYLVSLVAGLAIASAAYAADVYNGTYSTKDAPATAVATKVERPGFAGPYAGFSVSWQAMDVEHHGDLAFAKGMTENGFTYGERFGEKLADMSDQSFRGGVQVGYQWQLGRLYAGPRLAIDFGDVEAGLSRVDVLADGEHFSAQHNGKLTISSDFLATASFKLGVAITDNVGVYGVGGVSFADIDVNGAGSWSGEICDQPFSGQAPWQAANSESKFGWHIGAGVDFVMGDWNAFAEWTHHDLGTVESNGTVYGGLVAYNHEADITFEVVKAGINRRF